MALKRFTLERVRTLETLHGTQGAGRERGRAFK